MKIFDKITDDHDANRRLDLVLCGICGDNSREKIKKAILAGQCLINGAVERTPSCRICSGQHVHIELDEPEADLVPESGDIQVIWHDEDIAVINKPAGLTVHPCPSCTHSTVIQRLLNKFPQLMQQGGQRPGIVHRLDKDTSGIMIIALNANSRTSLAEAFGRHEIYKEYIAIVRGQPQNEGECRLPIGRDPASKIRMAILPVNRGGRDARTGWRKIWSDTDRDFSILAVRIHTGRTHQIRVHMARSGFPILGDRLYAPPDISNAAPRQLLHAWRIGFKHPASGKKLTFSCMPEEDFLDTPFRIQTQPTRVVITGNPGCGKSAFIHILAKKGIPVISADAIVEKIYAKDSPYAQWLAQHFGGGLLDGDGSINRQVLMRNMQDNMDFRYSWQESIHSIVLKEIENFWNMNRKKCVCGLMAAEIPLYFECGWQKIFSPRPVTVGIDCPQDMRFDRIRETRKWSENKILEIESWQWPESRKIAACDFKIENYGTLSGLEKESEELVATLLAHGPNKIKNDKTEIYKIMHNMEWK